MPCINPQDAHLPIASESKQFRLGPSTSAFEKKIKIPCGVCEPCLFDYSDTWKTHATLEALMWKNSLFLTLTYNEKNLTYIENEPSLYYKHVQEFQRKFRRAFGECKFMNAGEYGERKGRPHFHVIVFGNFPEIFKGKQVGVGKRGDPCYLSQQFTNLWGHGTAYTGDVEPATIGYVADYGLKNGYQKQWYKYLKNEDGTYVTDDDGKRRDFYLVDKDAGEIVEKKRPFMKISLKPAIGLKWLERYWRDVYSDGVIVLPNGVKKPAPRAFDNWMIDQGSIQEEMVLALKHDRE